MTAPPAAWPAFAGRIGALLREHAWQATSLGPIDEWPLERRRAVDFVLDVPLPALLLWGPEGVTICNGPYAELVQIAAENLLGRTAANGRAGALAGFQDQHELPSAWLARVLSGERLTLCDQALAADATRFADIELAPLRAENGRAVAALVIVVESTRRRAEAALGRVHEALELRIAERTAELGRMNEALAAEVAQRAHAEQARTELLRRLSSVQEDEQRRIARDLHDQVGQTLTALTLAVRAARDASPLPEMTAQRLVEVQRVADVLGREIHGLALRLRPTALDDLGLLAALGELLSEWSARAGIEVDFQGHSLSTERLPRELETVVYRLIQEALTNVARHADARHVSVVVERHDAHAIIMVEDDGSGFETEQSNSARFGLIGMRERVTLVGGTFSIESAPGQGTTVIARLPFEPSDESAVARGDPSS